MKKIFFLKENLIAHRGLHSKYVTENTLLSFMKAMDKDYTIEFDIHFLKDENIAVFHDFNLKRLTGKNEIIENLTLDKLNKLRLDKKFKIPILEEVLDLVKGKVPLLIEVKDLNNNGKFLEKLTSVLNNYNGQFAIQSMNPSVIDWFYKNRKDYIVGLILFNNLNYKLFKKYLKKVDFISINKKGLPFKSKKIVIGWTIKTKKEFEKYKSLCDNMICENII